MDAGRSPRRATTYHPRTTMREFALLNTIYRANDRLDRRVTLPPGDDMGAVRIDGIELLAAVDQVVAGRHVDLAHTPLALVGRKAITRSLSDIAAMAAQPVASLAAGVLPPDFGEQHANELFEAMRDTAAAYDCPLIGGDLAFHADPSHPLTLSVTVLAKPIDGDHPPVVRAGAKPGDRVYVTGVLGGSLQTNGLGHHLTFEPRIKPAIALARALGSNLHAMIDLSDGLGRDAGHIAEQSHVRIVLAAQRLPCRDGIDWRHALGDGEDYELCFTASGDVPDAIEDVPITEVGQVTTCGESIDGADDAWNIIVRAPNGELLDASPLGWEHLS